MKQFVMTTKAHKAKNTVFIDFGIDYQQIDFTVEKMEIHRTSIRESWIH